jgi:hypothetical protein
MASSLRAGNGKRSVGAAHRSQRRKQRHDCRPDQRSAVAGSGQVTVRPVEFSLCPYRTPSLKAIMARNLLGSTGLISRW